MGCVCCLASPLLALVDNAVLQSSLVQELYKDLSAVRGHICIAAIRAAITAAQTGCMASLPTLATVCQDVAWEKLHSGDWKDVAVAWRDLYSLACLLSILPLLSAHNCHPLALDNRPQRSNGVRSAPRATSGSKAAQPAYAIAAVPHPCTPSVTEDTRVSTADSGCLQQDCAWDASTGSCADLIHSKNMQFVGGGHSAGPGDSQPVSQPSCRWCKCISGHVQRSCIDGGCSSTPAVACQQALHMLDLAAMMGGPRFRPAVDAAISIIEAAANGMQAASSESREQPAKRLRTEAGAAPVEPGAAARKVPLPPLSRQSGDIPREELPSMERFMLDHMFHDSGGSPLIVTGCVTYWPAFKRWHDLGYLRRVAGQRTVPVEVGRHYLDQAWGQRLMPLAEFIDSHVLQGSPQSKEGAEGRGYLAQHPLFEQIPALKQDISVPEYCALGEGELQSINAWFGPPATVTPLHTDPHHNLLAQVVGAKYCRLYPPSVSAGLYAYTGGLTTNSSQVDVDGPDRVKFPLFEGLPFVDCILEAGEMLYIPVGWWHYVKSLSVSFSVSFWWR